MTQSIKEKLIEELLSEFTKKVSALQEEIQSLESSRNNESKSTAGDKHEVGRAMAQNELENLSRRISEQKERINLLNSLSIEEHDSIQLGSLVETQTGIFFISIGYGKLRIGSSDYWVISPASPIGQAMIGKKAKGAFSFNGRNTEILSVQ